MIHSLKVKNFYSFREEQEFSLSGTKSTADDQRFMTTSSGKNVAKVAMIYGANTSGKSNLLKAFSFLFWFLMHSWKFLEQEQEIPFSPFAFTNEPKEPTTFELVTECKDGTSYIYNLELTTNKILYESLRERKKGDVRFSLMFIREEENYKIYPRANFSLKDIPNKALRNNASFVSTIRQTNISSFDDFIQSIFYLVEIDGLNKTEFQDSQSAFKILLNNTIVKDFVEEKLCQIDLGIAGIDVEQKELLDDFTKEYSKLLTPFFKYIGEEFPQNRYDVYVHHSVGGQDFKLALYQESKGTQKAIPLLTKIFLTLNTGGILVYDEIEFSLHPLLIQSLLDLFYDEDMNPLGAQLICTCHSTDCMSHLHKRQIFLTEKDENQESSLIRLSDMIGVRNDDNFMQKYLSGAYGGVPCL